MTRTEIKYRPIERKNALTKGKVCHQAVLTHNRIFSVEETRKAFAEFTGLKTSSANLEIDHVCDFIVSQILLGNKINFGPFSVSLTMHGGLKAANGNPESAANGIHVALTPGKEFLEAAAKLKPVSVVSSGAGVIQGVLQQEPSVNRTEQLSAEGDRKIWMNGDFENCDPTAENCGVWVESDAGVCLCTGTEVEMDSVSCRFHLSGPIPTGEQWVVVCVRQRQTGAFLRFTRRVTVVSA